MTLSSGHGAFGLLTVVTVVLPRACQAHGAHQPLHGALGDCHPFAAQLMPDLARAVETEAGIVNTLDGLAQLVIAAGTSRSPVVIGKPGSMLVIGGRGDRQFPADRLDTQILAVRVDKRHHHLPWRSSSA